jgi:hypothetical protein
MYFVAECAIMLFQRYLHQVAIDLGFSNSHRPGDFQDRSPLLEECLEFLVLSLDCLGGPSGLARFLSEVVESDISDASLRSAVMLAPWVIFLFSIVRSFALSDDLCCFQRLSIGRHLGALCERLDGAFCISLDCCAAANSLPGDSR